MKAWMLLIATLGVVAIAGCGGGDSGGAVANEPPPLIGKPPVTVPEGPPPAHLKVEDLKEGGGAAVEFGDYVAIQYVGVDYETGKQFGSSWGGMPINFTVGAGKAIPGWEKGIEGMKPGGRRELIVPPGLGHGGKGSPSGVGPDDTLVFVIDLFEASVPPSNPH